MPSSCLSTASTVTPDQRPVDFDTIPQAGDWLRAHGEPNAASFVWFVGTTDGPQRIPVLALSVDGQLWRRDRGVIDLGAAYRAAESSVARLIVTSAGDLL